MKMIKFIIKKKKNLEIDKNRKKDNKLRDSKDKNNF